MDTPQIIPSSSKAPIVLTLAH
jgi:hypothetical protein